ncbi:MAG: Uma2 family endonuclease [Lachnospiraceae bacterium]|nr:Uma2 family endonuclease [Lachnospiraceae bacterium]
MPLPKEHLYTVDDIYNLPDGQRAELIDGQFYNMVPPSRKHQRLVTELCTVINNHIKANGGRCEADIAPFAVFLDKDQYTYVEPDISVICDPDKLTDRGCEGAPDWIIEIVSPASRHMDYMIKLFKYKSAGVREYWIIDPSKNRVMVYDFSHNETEVYTISDTVKLGIYDNVYIDFSQISLLI